MAQDALGNLAEADKLFCPPGDGRFGDHLLNPEAADYLEAGKFTVVTWNNVPRDGEDEDGSWVDRALTSAAGQEWSVLVVHDQHLKRLAGSLERFLDLRGTTMAYFLNYYNDAIGTHTTASLPGARRMIYVWRGSCSISGTRLEAGTATYLEDQVVIETKDTGAMLFRWDLLEDPAETSHQSAIRMGSMLRMSREIWSLDLQPGSNWLFRLDLINNPPGAVADVHTHQGPGIRALLTGAFTCRQPSEDGSADCPGDPWWETGIEAVISTPHETEVSKFLRCMILPPTLKGTGNSSTWHRKKIEPPPGWPIWTLLVDEDIVL